MTLTYGLRWEINTPPVSTTADKPLYVIQGIFDSNAIAAVPGPLWHTQFNNFAPRIGAAYQINSNTVVRGGGGIYYDLGDGNVGAGAWGCRTIAVQCPSFPRQCLSICRIQLSSFHRSRRHWCEHGFDIYNADEPPPASAVSNVYSEKSPLSGNSEPASTLTASYVGSDGRQVLGQDTILAPQLASLGSSAIGERSKEWRLLALQRFTGTIPAPDVAWSPGAGVLYIRKIQRSRFQ